MTARLAHIKAKFTNADGTLTKYGWDILDAIEQTADLAAIQSAIAFVRPPEAQAPPDIGDRIVQVPSSTGPAAQRATSSKYGTIKLTGDFGGTAGSPTATVGVRENGSLVGRRRFVNFLDGAAVVFTLTDDSGNSEVEISAGLAVATDHGTYTPTLTNSANIDASTAYQCQYMRVGNTVTVSGKVDVDVTAANTLTTMGVSLPVASNFALAENAGGSGATSADVLEQAISISADPTNDGALFQWKTGADTANKSYHFSFTYLVI